MGLADPQAKHWNPSNLGKVVLSGALVTSRFASEGYVDLPGRVWDFKAFPKDSPLTVNLCLFFVLLESLFQ